MRTLFSAKRELIGRVDTEVRADNLVNQGYGESLQTYECLFQR